MRPVAHRQGAAAPLRRARAAAVGLLLLACLLAWASQARADDGASTCQGPPDCCPAQVDLESPVQHDVQVGVVLVGIYGVAEKTSTWTADYYLYEQWQPAPGFTPQTEIVNEVERQSLQFDSTELRDGRCTRTRRIHSTLRTLFNLRSFPFDEQQLTLEVSDAEFTSKQVRYAGESVAGIDDGALLLLTGWRITKPLRYEREARAFKFEPGAPDYDYATFSVAVRRHVSYHLSKFFLPLFLIVVVSFAVFWIDPGDLAAALQISVTCLLAVVALQFAEASDLPDVSYLTLADRIYATSYVCIALATLQAVYTNALVRADQRQRALQVDRVCRMLFPAALVIAVTVLAVRVLCFSG